MSIKAIIKEALAMRVARGGRYRATGSKPSRYSKRRAARVALAMGRA